MSLTITLPKKIAEQIQRKADEGQLSVEEVAITLLQNALNQESDRQDHLSSRQELVIEGDDNSLTPEEIVARLKALELSDVSDSRTGSSATTLRNIPCDPAFNLAAWDRQWAEIEAELKAMPSENDTTEQNSLRG